MYSKYQNIKESRFVSVFVAENVCLKLTNYELTIGQRSERTPCILKIVVFYTNESLL